VFFGVVFLPDDRQILHIKSRLLKFLDGGFGVGVGMVYGDDGIIFIHRSSGELYEYMVGRNAAAAYRGTVLYFL
jgi:hypothetical protein